MSWIIKVDNEFTQVIKPGSECWVESVMQDSVVVTCNKEEAKKFEWLAAAELEANWLRLVWKLTVEIVEVAEEETK